MTHIFLILTGADRTLIGRGARAPPLGHQHSRRRYRARMRHQRVDLRVASMSEPLADIGRSYNVSPAPISRLVA